MTRPIVIGVVLLSCLTGCPTEDNQRVRPREDFGDPGKGEPLAMGSAPPEDLSMAPPEVSRSLGHKGGIIVLWPHIVPPSTDPVAHAIAERVQNRLVELAHRAGGARNVDVRPEPETVCSTKAGCEATSVSAVIVMKGTTCAVAALMAGPKKSLGHLLPWSGKAEFQKDVVGFGESPDALVKVKECVPCDALIEKRENEEAALARYITGLLPAH